MRNFAKVPFDHDDDGFPDIFDLGLGYKIIKDSMEEDDENDWDDDEKDEWDDDDDGNWEALPLSIIFISYDKLMINIPPCIYNSASPGWG